jgi:hypothetical protein
MKRTTGLLAGLMLGATMLAGCQSVQSQAQTPTLRAGAACGATSETAVPDNAVEPISGRQFILQYPCDLKKGEEIVLVLNIHGAGSSSQYQHRYFPAGDYAQKYRLVVATPTAAAAMPGRVWRAEADDQFLHNLTELMFKEFGRANIRSFWLAGHSQGGATSARIVCSEFFKTKVDGFFSLSGGRQGGATQRNPQYNAPAVGAPVPESVPGQGPGPAAVPGAAPATPPAPAADGPSTCDYSHIVAYGAWEVAAMPEQSTIADKFGCTSRVARPAIVDERAGYVWDPTRQNPTRIGWGREPRPGTAKMWVFEGCKDKRVVADVLRVDKGHTEGLEPKVTEEIVRLIVSAKGGRAQAG